jgi:hypothetical protein
MLFFSKALQIYNLSANDKKVAGKKFLPSQYGNLLCQDIGKTISSLLWFAPVRFLKDFFVSKYYSVDFYSTFLKID